MRFRSLSLAIALFAAPLVAEAQPFEGIYIGAGAGYNLPQNYPLAGGGALQPLAGGATFQPMAGGGSLHPQGGVVGLGSAGFALGNGMRFELEGNYRHADLGRTGSPAVNASGSIQTYGVMANALFDMDIGTRWVYPYIGGGVGYAWTHLSRSSFSVAATTAAFRQSISDTEGGFAFQAIGGLSFPIPGVPGLSITTEYRFFGIPFHETFSQGVAVTPVSLAAGALPSFSLRVNNQYNHSFLLGVRYAFNVLAPVPKPAEEPPPAPAAARSYLVFFDWDKATLTDRARQIIKDAADNSTHVQYTRIEVNGYTDTSGTHQYNQGLSVRRARAVQAELIKDGVPQNAITIQGFGDTNLLVPTGPGVREPQNRRVEIVIR